MTTSNESESASGCSGHDHDAHEEKEEEKAGCSCGGICGKRKLLDDFKQSVSDAESEAGFEMVPDPVS